MSSHLRRPTTIDLTAAAPLPGAPPDQVAKALYNRGVRKGMQGDTAGEIADLTAAIELPGAPPDRVAMACANLGALYLMPPGARQDGAPTQGRPYMDPARRAEARHWLERALEMAEHLPDKGERVKGWLEEMKGDGGKDNTGVM